MSKKKLFWCLDSYGWPVETITGHYIGNFFRLLFRTRKIVRHWKQKPYKQSDDDPMMSCSKQMEEEDGNG